MARWIQATATVTLTALAIAATLWAIWRAGLALTLTALGILLSVALDHLVRWLERRRVPRGLGIAAVALGILVVLAAIGFLVVPPAIAQLGQLARSGPALLRRVEHGSAYRFLDEHVDVAAVLARLRERAPSLASSVVERAVAVVSVVATGVAGLVTLLFVVVFMLGSGPPLVRAVLQKIPPDRRPIYVDVVAKLYDALGGYIGGLFLLVLSNLVLSGVFLAIVGVPYFLPLAVFAGLSSLIPFAGAIVAGALLSIVAWASGGLWLGVATLAYYVAYQQVENHVISPLVYKRTVDLNPLVVLLAVLFMVELAGIPGAIVAVPLASTVQIVLRELFRLHRERLRLEGRARPPGA